MFIMRPSLYTLPVAFAVILFGGYPILEDISLYFGYEEPISFVQIKALIVILASLILQFWLLALASGQPAYKPWKMVLLYNLVIILPGSFAYPFSFMLFVFFLGFKNSALFIIFISSFSIITLMCWSGYRLLNSKLFSSYLGKGFGGLHIFFLISSGFTMFILNVLITSMAFSDL